MRYAARADGCQASIVKALRQVGASVQHLHTVGQGCPDLLVGYKSLNYLMEVKDPAGKVGEDQQDWHEAWKGQCCVVRSVSEALEVLGAMTPEMRRARSNYKSTPQWQKKGTNDA